MLRQRTHWIFAAVAVWVLTTPETLIAQPINYGDFMGTKVTYLDVTEEDPANGFTLYGSPTAFDDSLSFSPIAFNASGNSGGGMFTDGVLTFAVQARPFYAITDILFNDAGNTTLTGFGTDATMTEVTAPVEISILEVDGMGISPVALNNTLIFSPSNGSFGQGTDGGGGPFFSTAWMGSLAADIEQALTMAGVPFTLGATKLSVQLANSLVAMSEASSSAQIGKNSFEVFVDAVDPLRQPATLIDPGLSFWTDAAAWTTNPLFPNNGNGGFTYDVVIENGGTVLIPAMTDIVIQGLALDNGAIIRDGSLSVQEDATWTGGALSGAGSASFTGTATISGSAPKSVSGVLNNSGTMTWQEGTVSFAQSGMVDAELRNTGTIEMAGNGTSFALSSGSPVVVNEATGTLRRLPIPGTATIDVTTLNHGTVEVQSSTLEFTRGLTNSSTGTIAGSGTIIGAVTNNGRLSPGSLPGETAILTITGNYEQQADGVLAIDVGGLAPGPGHDQLVVVGMPGTASLAGRLELPIVGGFMPAVNDEITFLTASMVNGTFDSIFSSNLASEVPGRAILLLYNPGGPGSAGDVRARFVMPATGGQLISPNPTSEWSTPGTWSFVPDSTHIVELQNTTPIPRRVDVQIQNAFTHQLTVTGNGPLATMTVGVFDGRSLSATAGVTVGQNAAVELVGGNLVSSNVNVMSGGQLVGNGTVVGNLSVGTAGGIEQATLSPGFSVGHLDVVGDYQQGASGLLKIDVDGTAEGDFDTVNVTGNVDLGGTLTFDVTNLTAESGTFRFLTAGSSEPPGDMLENTFQNVDTVGNDDIYVALSFGETPQGAGGASLSGGTFDANGEICSVGDMNCSGDIDMADVPLFARALRTPTTYHQYTWNTIVKIIFANDAGNVDGLNNGLDFDDIDDFALVVAGSGSGATVASVLAAIEAALHAVPEPSSSTSWFIGACLLAFTGSANRRRSRR